MFRGAAAGRPGRGKRWACRGPVAMRGGRARNMSLKKAGSLSMPPPCSKFLNVYRIFRPAQMAPIGSTPNVHGTFLPAHSAGRKEGPLGKKGKVAPYSTLKTPPQAFMGRSKGGKGVPDLPPPCFWRESNQILPLEIAVASCCLKFLWPLSAAERDTSAPSPNGRVGNVCGVSCVK